MSLVLVLAQSAAEISVFSSSVYAKAVRSPYKKSFKRSKRIYSTKSRRRLSSGSCILWNANKINNKASQFNTFINQYAHQFQIDSNLIKAIITAESCFKVKALSPKGAQGLMQLIPATAKRFGVNNSYHPKHNIRGGTNYLRFLHDYFKGDLKKVIAAYNAGEGAVTKYKGIPPYKETEQYVSNVLRVYAALNPKLNKPKRVKSLYKPPALGNKAGRQGWRYNKLRAPHLYKKIK